MGETDIKKISDSNKGTSRYWKFTWNNYTEEDFERLQHWENNECNYIILGREVGEVERTPHIEGYVEWSTAIRMDQCILRLNPRLKTLKRTERQNNELFKVFKSAAHMRPGGIAYCKKGIQSHAEYVELGVKGPNYGVEANFVEKFFKQPREGQGERTDWQKVKDFIKEGHTFAEIAEEWPEYAMRYTHGIKAMMDAFNEEKSRVAFEKTFDDVILRTWQKKLLNEVLCKPDDRKIIWYYDREGNCGKSWMGEYLVAKHKAEYFCNAKSADIAHAYRGGQIVVLDLARTTEGQVNYQIIEQLKNGMIFSPKYDSRLKIHARPHVVIFSNYLPCMGALSADRWSIRELSEKDNVPHVEPVITEEEPVEVPVELVEPIEAEIVIDDNIQVPNDEPAVQAGNANLEPAPELELDNDAVWDEICSWGEECLDIIKDIEERPTGQWE